MSAVNESGISSHLSPAVLGLTLTSDTPPVIIGITPITDEIIGRRTAITVRAEDATGLSAITLQYYENGNWNTLERRNVRGLNINEVHQAVAKYAANNLPATVGQTTHRHVMTINGVTIRFNIHRLAGSVVNIGTIVVP